MACHDDSTINIDLVIIIIIIIIIIIESHDTGPRQMQEINSLCTDSRALRAEYCIVGIPHYTAI